MDNTKPLPELCIEDGVNLRPAGPGRYYGKCPFHHDSRPSFQVKIGSRGYWTFKCWSTNCGVHGGLSRYCELTNRTPPETPERPDARPQRLAPVSPELCHRAAQHYNEQLLQHQEATDYLRNRGIDPEMAHRWGLGYAPGDTLYRELRHELDAEAMKTCYLFRINKREDRQGRRIIIPHWTPQGKGGWHTARAIDPDRQRPYQSLPGRRPQLLSLRSAFPATPLIILVEGPFDMMACLVAGYDARCTAGNPAPERLASAIRALPAARVGILPDRDDAGDQWAELMLSACRRAAVPALLLELPDPFKDPGETLTASRHGPRAAIGTAIRIARTKQAKPKNRRS